MSQIPYFANQFLFVGLVSGLLPYDSNDPTTVAHIEEFHTRVIKAFPSITWFACKLLIEMCVVPRCLTLMYACSLLDSFFCSGTQSNDALMAAGYSKIAQTNVIQRVNGTVMPKIRST